MSDDHRQANVQRLRAVTDEIRQNAAAADAKRGIRAAPINVETPEQALTRLAALASQPMPPMSASLRKACGLDIEPDDDQRMEAAQ